MKAQNLISVYQGAAALEDPKLEARREFKILKSHEIRNLHSFCDIMCDCGCGISDLDGFFVGYSIGQIGKEFDLLRFGDVLTLNIEIKSELKIAKKKEKILKQMRVNYYYLKFLGRSLKLFTYVDKDGFYEYDVETDTVNKIEASSVAACIRGHIINYSIDPDREFIPSNYLVSPFNSPDKFMADEYFLTSAQQKIKEEIFTELETTPFMYFSISANAGTGKTLLMYDIAKDMIRSGNNISIIHCGMINEGHNRLMESYGWKIYSIREVKETSIDSILEGCSVVFIDESQRIRESQLEVIIQKSIEKHISMIFSYDVKQFLKRGEGRDIGEYLREKYADIKHSPKKLTNKIRTNKEMASFISNLRNIGSSKDHLNYDCVTIDYLNDMEVLKEYIDFLSNNGWTALTYTTSQYSSDPYDDLSRICEKNAHDVIGQEFSKVVFVMDSNFRYNGNKITARNSYYSAPGMLYQIVTRVVDDLKIVVFNNPDLYLKLLEIKAMGE